MKLTASQRLDIMAMVTSIAHEKSNRDINYFNSQQPNITAISEIDEYQKLDNYLADLEVEA